MSHRARFSGGPIDNSIIELPNDCMRYNVIELVQPPFVLDAAYNTYPDKTECRYVEHKYMQSVEDPHLYWYTGSDYMN